MFLYLAKLRLDTKTQKHKRRYKMSERPKTVSLDAEVHKALKLLCAENGWTMTQAVEKLMQIAKEQGQNERENGSGKAD